MPSFQQKHYPPGSGGCVRTVKINQHGKYTISRSNGDMNTMEDSIQDAIKNAIDNGDDMAIYEYKGSKYYIDLKNKIDDDDDKSDDMSDIEDLMNDDSKPGMNFVGDGTGEKVDIPFNSQQTVKGLQQSIADKMKCDPQDLELLAYVDGEFVEVKYKTLDDNKVKDPKDLIIFKKEDKTEAVKKLIRAKKWDDKEFRKNAKSWLKETGNEGKQGIDNLITKNGLAPGWNDVLSGMKYDNVLKIIKDENFMSKIDKIRVDKNTRKQYGLTTDQVTALTFTEISKMNKKTKALREKFYEDMSKAALKGTDMKLNPDCSKYFDQFEPPYKTSDGKTMGFFGIICLIDGKDLKAMGIPCKNVDSIKAGQVYVYPSSKHNKNIKLGDKTENGSFVNPLFFAGTGHGQLCEKSGLPKEYCAGFAITPPTLKFRSGTCNSTKIGKIKGFDNKALNDILQNCLKNAFKGTKAYKFYSKIDDRK